MDTDRPELQLASPTIATVLQHQAQLEQEAADRDLAALQPMSKLRGEQVDLFHPQASIFDAPATTGA